jgi:hypothetical membrane protein
MQALRKRDRIALASLGFAVAAPVLYYGIQLVAAPFLPGFSFLGTTASELGSDRSTHPFVFNCGVILTGTAALLASVGFLRSLRSLGANPILTWLTSFAVAVTGLASLWGGIFPLPDPRHSGHPSMLIVMILVPVLMGLVSWTIGASPRVKAYFAATIGLLIIMVPVMSGMTGLDTHTYRGLFQRVFALTVFPPIGVAGYVLARRIRQSDPEYNRHFS